MKPAILFVYGTLKRGGKNVGLMHGQRYLCDAVTAPKYRVYDLGAHPALVTDTENGFNVRGELWEVSEVALAELDEFEEVPTWFDRQPIEVADFTGIVEAYFYQHAVPPSAPSADRWPRPID